MCLQAPGIPKRGTSNPPAEQRASPATPVTTRPKDAAFKEFLRLQNGFEWNGMFYSFREKEKERKLICFFFFFSLCSHYTVDLVPGAFARANK